MALSRTTVWSAAVARHPLPDTVTSPKISHRNVVATAINNLWLSNDSAYSGRRVNRSRASDPRATGRNRHADQGRSLRLGGLRSSTGGPDGLRGRGDGFS